MAFGLDFPRIGDTTGKRPTFYPHQIRDPRTDTKVLRYLGGLNKAHLTLIITDLLGLMMNIRVVMPCLEGEKEPSISMTLTEPTTISTIAPSPSPSPSPFPRHPLSQPQPSTPQSATLPSSSHLRVSTPTIQPNDGLLTPRRSVSPYSPRGRSPLAASCVPASAARPFTASIIAKPSPTYPQQTLSPTPVRPGPASLDIAAATQPTSVHNKKPVVATNRPTQSGSQPINVSAQSQPMAGQKRKAMASTMPTQTTVLQASNLLMGSSFTAEWVGSPESVSSGGFSSPVSQQSVALQHQVQSQYYSQHLAVPEGLGSPFDGRLLKRQRYNPGQVLGWPPTDLS